MNRYISWGLTRANEITVLDFYWQEELIRQFSEKKSLLVSGNHRSYGDSCFTSIGSNISSLRYNRYITLDKITGLLECCAGVLLSELNELTIPLGWFIPVTPGTKAVTIGGMIANDVHGKNHHVAGTFGNHVNEIKLYRSDMGLVACSAVQNQDIFAATIGGLGLTGAILECKLQLKSIPSASLFVENHTFLSFAEFEKLSIESDNAWEYTVAWLDGCSVKGDKVNGIFSRGNHLKDKVAHLHKKPRKSLRIPFLAPNVLLNNLLIKYFNQFYFRRMRNKPEGIQGFDEYFYPLDGLDNWNRLYGKRGFFQYQCVVPLQGGLDVIREILSIAKSRRQPPFLSVLKRFGQIPSPGLMSFPQPGYTLAVDFPNRGKSTRAMLDEFDALVLKHHGRLYPAKDARMNAATFAAMYPAMMKFKNYLDPICQSDFWRRVTAQ